MTTSVALLSKSLLYKSWKTAAMTATGYIGDSPLFLMDYLLRFVRVATLLTIWRTILGETGAAWGMPLEAVLTYTLVAEVFAAQLSVRSGLDVAIWDGSIATRFVQPFGMVGQFAAEMLGQWCFGLVAFSTPLLLAAPLLGVNPLPANALAAPLFLTSLVLAVSVGMALDFLFTALMVAFEWSIWDVQRLRAAMNTLLSGALIPLALLPWGLGEVFAWLPFASMASAPLKIYTGTGDALQLMAMQAGWSVLLWPLAHRLWQANRERVVGYGG